MTTLSRKTDTTNLTLRVSKRDKSAWREKARRAGTSLNRYVSYVMNRTNLRVSMKTTDETGG
jgi:predicted HicB family RNase H-like nuclease